MCFEEQFNNLENIFLHYKEPYVQCKGSVDDKCQQTGQKNALYIYK